MKKKASRSANQLLSTMGSGELRITSNPAHAAVCDPEPDLELPA